MPKLGKTETTRVDLPSSTAEDPAYVMVRTTLLLGDISGINSDEGEASRAISLLANVIEDWNFTDDNNEKLPVTKELVQKLELSDFTFLSDWINKNLKTGGLTAEEKKSSIGTSITVTEAS